MLWPFYRLFRPEAKALRETKECTWQKNKALLPRWAISQRSGKFAAQHSRCSTEQKFFDCNASRALGEDSAIRGWGIVQGELI